MVDQIQSTIDSKALITKLRASLDKINNRLSATKNTSIASALAEANSAFKTFFDTLQDPLFYPELFMTGDTARSEAYNNNLLAISKDIERFYDEIDSLGNAQIKSYNFSKTIINEITKRANSLASIVLDLNILNGYNRSDTIVAGDDFKSNQYIDTEMATASSRAEATTNGFGIGLARNGSNNVLDGARIEVIPIAPSNGSTVNTSPTAGNLERFYEGNYYNFIGTARPEGGQFNIRYIMNSDAEFTTTDTGAQPSGIFVEIGATKEDKLIQRSKMVDGNVGTFWECEYLYKLPDQLFDFPDALVVDNESNSTRESTATVDVNMDAIEKAAQEHDTEAIDLVVDLVITLPGVTSVNFLSINPVLFGANAFPEVEDIATASTTDGEFKTVDGWNNIRFAKTITPEANEFLTDSQMAASLAPNRNNYMGQGIYPFPVRQAKKIRVRLRSRKPVASPYERTYVLMKRQVDITTKTVTTTTRGRLSF